MINPLKDKGKNVAEQQKEAIQKYRADMLAHFIEMGNSVGLTVTGTMEEAEDQLIAWAQNKVGDGNYTPESEYKSVRNIPYVSYIFGLAKNA